jgi:hypothetical protein
MVTFYFVTCVVLSYSATFITLGAIFFSILIFLVLYYTYLSTIIDPTDPTVYLERLAKVKGYDAVGFNPDNYEFYCNIC